MDKVVVERNASASDLPRLAELVCRYPDEHLHVADLPYRLSSWSLDTVQNVCLWEDRAGELMGFGVIQLPWMVVDYAFHPEARNSAVEYHLMRWAKARGEALADERRWPVRLQIIVRETQPERSARLEILGFARGAAYTLHMARSLTKTIPAADLPAGFALRALRGADEIVEYVGLHQAAFGTTNMTNAWRQRMLSRPEYRPELDVVAVAPDGRLAAFCVGWLYAEGAEGQVEPLGVHPDFRGLGLGRAILLEGLRRLCEHGAARVLVETFAGNGPARSLYEAAGFRVEYATVSHERSFAP